MQKFVLDTGVIPGYIRAAGFADNIERKYAPFTPPNIPLISVVSKGEIYSLAKQFGWGGGKLKTLDELLRKLPTVDISHDQIIQRYAEIDAFSLGKIKCGLSEAVTHSCRYLIRSRRHKKNLKGSSHEQDNQRTT